MNHANNLFLGKNVIINIVNIIVQHLYLFPFGILQINVNFLRLDEV